MKRDSGIWCYASVLISGLAYGGIAYGIQRTQFYNLLVLYGILCIGYGFLLYHSKKKSSHLENYGLYVAIAFRLIFLFSTPVLSDDFYRFFWDGKLLIQGYNPYLYLPSQLIENGNAFSLGLYEDLYKQLNSPHYYTVYPPINQLFFALSALIFPRDIWGAVIIMRLIIIAAEWGTLWFLRRMLSIFHLAPSSYLIYALNPLVILELTGNLHFEAVVIFFLLASLYILLIYSKKELAKVHPSFEFGFNGHAQQFFTTSKSLAVSAFSYSLAIATKLIPLIFLPIFMRKFSLQMAIRYYIMIFFLTLLLFFPFFDPVLFENIFSSINLYFQNFEFNASIYYLVRWYGYQVYGYNIIASSGKMLSWIALISILLVAWLKTPKTWQAFFSRLLFMLSIHYFLATTVHPWYICTLVLFSVFSTYRFAVIWSMLVIVSYAAYQTDAYQENLYLIALEYVIVYSWLGYELIKPYYYKYFLGQNAHNKS